MMLLHVAATIGAFVMASQSPTSHAHQVEMVARMARGYLGEQYVYGDTGEEGFDCSSFVQAVFRDNGYFLPRTSREQATVGEPITQDDVRPGDLLFFTQNPGSQRITHVGIALGHNRMIHASRGRQHVVISKWDQPYFLKRWFAARRIR